MTPNPSSKMATLSRKRSIATILTVSATLLFASSNRAAPIIEIEKIGDTMPMMSASDTRALFATDDGEHYAFLSGEGSRQHVVIDGIAGPTYTQVGTQALTQYSLTFNPNYPERPPQYVPNRKNIAFMRGGDQAVYIAQKEGNAHIVVAQDGVHQEWPALGQLQLAALSPGSLYTYAAYSIREGRTTVMRMIINGELSPEGTSVQYQTNDIAFHEPEEGPSHYAYIGRNGKMVNNRRMEYYRVYIDGVPGPEFQTLQTRQLPLTFIERDGKLGVAYLARKAQEQGERVVIQYLDGTSYQSEPGVDPTSVRISADKNAVAWIQTPVPDPANRYNRPATVPVSIFINGDETYSYEADFNEARSTSRTFRLSPDGSRWAIERMIQGSNAYTKFMLLDGLRGQEYPMTEQSTFVPGTQRHYFVAINNRNRFVVIDGIEYGPYNQISPIVSSDSGQSIIWHATTDNGGALYVNGSPVTFGETSSPQIALRFQPGTENYVALASEPEGLFLHVGNRKFRADSRSATGPIFSEDGSRLAMYGEFYPRPGQPGSRLLVDGEPLSNIAEEITVDERAWKGFSPDNKHFIAFATTRERSENQNRGAGTVLVDGFELGPLFYNHASDGRFPHFLEDGRFRFYGIYDHEIRRISIDLDAAATYGKAKFEAAQKSGGKTIFTVDPELKLTSLSNVTVRDGNVIYGTAQGGEYGMGALYRVNTDGSDFQVLHTFLGGGQNAQNPSSLVLGNDGYLYGMAGANSFAYVRPQVIAGLFRIRTDGTGYEVVKTYEYSNAFRTSPILECLAPDGSLLARGPVPNAGRSPTDGLLKIDPNTGKISEIYRANSYPEDGQPIYKLLVPFEDGGDGYYYGHDARNLYRFTLDGNAPTPIYTFKGFPLDGDSVTEPPVFHGDWLYGMTRGGGKNRLGTIYRLKRDGSDYEVLLHQERDKNFIALAAGPTGVWGYRNGLATVKNRQTRIPFLERLDSPGGEPRSLEKIRLGNNLWFGDYQGETSLFSLSGVEINVISMDQASTTPPTLTTETIPAKPLREGTSTTLSF